MSNSRFVSSDVISSTIGFRFHANDEELEEVSDNPTDKNSEEKVDNISCENDVATPVIDPVEILSNVKEQRNLLGKRSISVDSAYESPFSNPIETWKKLNVLKEKITKTVEEKLHEMKIDCNVLSKSSRSKFVHSKENSSISDSEDTSESSRMSEQWKDAENQISPVDKTSSEISEPCVKTLISLDQPQEEVEQEIETKESENELRNRKCCYSEQNYLPDIKIATAEKDVEGSLVDSSFTDEVESGVEADENLDATEEDSIDFFDGETSLGVGGSQNPPSGGRIFLNILGCLTSMLCPKSNTFVFLIGFTLYFFFPLSEFFKGFIFSLMLILLWGMVKSYVRPDDTSQQQRPFVLPDYKSMPPLKVPESKPVKGIWFNEYENENYDPEYYSVTQTVPAYLELDNNILKVSRPKGKIHRRATYDEPEYKLQIISQRIYNIGGCNIYLLPDGLTRKRLFSKKYPVVIFLRPDSLVAERKAKHNKEADEKEVLEDSGTENTFVCSPKSPKNTLYFFARCDRQKEEWYRKLLAATRLHSTNNHKKDKIREVIEDAEKGPEKTPLDESPNKETHTPFETLFFDDEIAQLEEYLHYMAKFVNVEVKRHEVTFEPDNYGSRKSKSKKKDVPGHEVFIGHVNIKNNSLSHDKKNKTNGTSINLEGTEEKRREVLYESSQVQWFSAFINRILFDVFRSPFWIKKIQDKVQRKLNSIRLPYYIEDIEVIEMDLGKTGPMFHRVSQPHMDERGLWFDMDMSFDGLIKLTIQTHLNLVKLQKGVEENEEAGASISEKLAKGKKRQKVEKEYKDSFANKESKEMSKELKTEKNKIEPLPSTKPCLEKVESKVLGSQLLNNGHKAEDNSFEDFDSKLIDEVAKFAEIAVEESLCVNKETNSKPITTESPCPEVNLKKTRSPIYDSEVEDSAESSDEDQEEELEQISQPVKSVTTDVPSQSTPKRYPRNRRSSKKIFKVFENVAQSKYFRSMAQSKYIQKAIAGVSAAKLRLTLEVKSCTGILTINIPPPPSDRFWYGFREMPVLVFSANPKIGDKALRFGHIKNYLQKKILHEVKKVMVTPNMIDLVLPTSAPARSSSFLQIEESDMQEPVLLE